MKNILKITTIFLMSIVVFSCSKDSAEEPTPEIQISLEKTELKVGEETNGTLSGGDGKNYKVELSEENVVTLLQEGDKIKLTAKGAGSVKITITSADKTVEKTVVVEQVPTLSETGVYSLDAQPLFTIKSEYVGANKHIFSDTYLPNGAKNIAVKLLDNPQEGNAKIQILSVQGLPELATGELAGYVEKVSATFVQVRTEKYRFVIAKN